MNWKKWIKYTGLSLLALMIITAIVAPILLRRGMNQIYGGNTKLVDFVQFKPLTGSIAVKNVNVLAKDSEYFMTSQTVLIQDGLIKTIDSTLVIPAQTKIIDGKGKYLIPGLIDSHVHLFKSPNDLLLYLANGVTEIREMGGEEFRLDLKKEIENGRIGPKMWVASPPLGTANDLGSWFISMTRSSINVDDAKEAEEMIETLFKKGYDGVKIYSHLNKESYLAATKKAKALGMPIVGHIPWSVALTDVWSSGQNEIAHIEEVMNALRRNYGRIEDGEGDKFLAYVTEESASIADNLLANDIAVTTTLWLVESFVRQKFELDKVLSEIPLAYVNPGMVEGVKFGSNGFGWLPETNLYRLPEGLTAEQKSGHKHFWETYAKAAQVLIRELSKRGVKMIAGTDAVLPPTVPGFSLHSELGSLQKAGMTNAQVLQAATAVAADFLKSNTGKIIEGYEANLVLLDKNPLDDIRHTKAINTVFSNGKVYDRDLLDQMLAAVKEVNDAGRTIDISQYEAK